MERPDKHCPKRQNSAAAKHRKRDTDFEYEQISTAAKRKKCDISDDNSRSSNYVASQSEGESGKNSAAAKHRKRDTDFEYEQISTAANVRNVTFLMTIVDPLIMLRHNQRVNRGKMANADQFRMRVLRIYPIMTVPWILMIPLLSVKLTLLNLQVHGFYQKASQILLRHMFVTSMWGIRR